MRTYAHAHEIRLRSTCSRLPACISLLLVRSGLDKTSWVIISSVRVVYSCNFSRVPTEELGDHIHVGATATGMSSSILVAAKHTGLVPRYAQSTKSRC